MQPLGWITNVLWREVNLKRWLCSSIYMCVCESHSVMSDSLQPRGLQPARLLYPWNSPGQNTGVGSYSVFQGIFPIQGLNPGLPHCRQILYQIWYQGSPRILEWVAHSFSSGISQSRNRTRVSCILGKHFYQLSCQGRPFI